MAGRPDGVARWGRALFALEPQPLALRLAVRGALGLIVPLLAGQALAWPSLNVVALSAFLLAFGDLTEDRGWLARLAAGSLVGAFAVASGVLAGGHPATAALAMLGWGVLLSVAGVYGDGAAAMALPVAWLFFEIGLPTPERSIGAALERGALILAAGGWAILLAWVTRLIRHNRPLVERTAQCYTLLANYVVPASGDRGPHSPAHGYHPSRETRVRSAIADARALAVDMRRGDAAASRPVQRLVLLIELADRIFCLAGVEDEIRARGPFSALLADGARAVARLLLGHGDADAITRVLAALERAARQSGGTAGAAQRTDGVPNPNVNAASVEQGAEIRRLLAMATAHALRLAQGDDLPSSAPAPVSAGSAGRPARWLERALAPLSTVFDRRSIVARHALRYGVVTAAAVALDTALAPPFGYWIPLTITVVLKPYAGSTLTRAGQRLTGTIAGVSTGVLLVQILGEGTPRAIASALAFFGTLAVLPLNYAAAIYFLSSGIVPLDTLIYGTPEWQVGMLRVLDTCVGGALALAGGYLLWPSFERQSLPAMLEAALASTALYADRVLAGPAGAVVSNGDLERARRRAGVDNTNLQASFQRVVAEPGADADRMQAAFVAVVALQRLLLTLNTLRELGSTAAPGRQWAGFRDRVRRELGDLPAALRRESCAAAPSAARSIAHDLADGADRGEGLLAREVERVALQIDVLRGAVERIGAAGLEREPTRGATREPGAESR